MASGIELAKAYVQIVPSAEGIEAALEGEISGPAKEAGKKGGEESGSAFGEKFKGALKAVGKLAVGAATTATAAIISMTKSSVESYAEYEQLAGGAKLMWGDAYSYIAERAESAFKNVQMSTNDYLTAANYYATGLKTALGGDVQSAANLADAIITAQADIVAATGNSAEAVQNAFNGVMRGNYTMLDNLGLGIAGTKEGMLSVIDSVNKWRKAQGIAGELTIKSMADCEQALVDYVKMQGMAGYAAEEGSQTIQGSISSMSAAWNNLLTGMADPKQSMAGLVLDLVDTVVAVGENIIPVISQIVPNVISGFNMLVTALIPEIPGLIEQILPGLAEAIVRLTNSLVLILPTIVQTLVDAFPVEQLMTIILNIITAIGQTLPTLLQAGVELVTTLVDNIGTVFTDMLPVIGQAGIDLVMTLVDYAVENAPTFIPELINIIMDAAARLTDAESLSKFLDVSLTLINALVQGLVGAIPILCEAIPQIITDFCNFLASDGFDDFMNTAGEIIITLGNGIIEAIPILLKNIPKVLEAMLHAFANIFEGMLDVGWNIVAGLWEGIKNAGQWLKDLIKGWVGNVLSFIRKLFSIDSPSKKMAYMGKMLDYGLAEGIEGNMRPIRDAMRGVADMTTGTFNSEIAVRSSVRTGDAAYGSMGTLIGAVEGLGRKMEKMQVVLDSGVMIGTVDMGIGRNTARAERGVAYA